MQRHDHITKSQAKEFYRDLCGTVNGNANKTCQGIMSVDMIADHMQLSLQRTMEYLYACAEYGITEKQGGLWVI